jgi:adenine-specific DNA-methyltransferase
MHDHILAYAKSKINWLPNLLPRTDKSSRNYSNPDDDPRGPWTTNAIQARNYYSLGTYEIVSPSERVHRPPTGTYWRISKETFDQLNTDNRVWWGKEGNSIPRIKKFLEEAKRGIVPATLWPHSEAGTNAEAKQEVRNLLGEGDEIFLTPKPEKLIKQVLTIASNPSDFILDSFLGSGTTAAVAHKMGRHYIGIELGDHAVTHCAPRLRKVIDGEQGGISESLGWKGGGGCRFYRLGDPVFDEAGHISPGIRFAPLAAHLWFVETGFPFSGGADSPLLGSHDGIAYYLLYNGILGDKRPNGGNVLTSKILAVLPPFDGPKVVFGESCRLSAERLKQERITFRQIPYEIKAR